jgi:hypothetical protein
VRWDLEILGVADDRAGTAPTNNRAKPLVRLLVMSVNINQLQPGFSNPPTESCDPRSPTADIAGNLMSYLNGSALLN